MIVFESEPPLPRLKLGLVSMKGMSMLSAMDRMCSDVTADLGPKIPTTPFSETHQKIY